MLKKSDKAIASWQESNKPVGVEKAVYTEKNKTVIGIGKLNIAEVAFGKLESQRSVKENHVRTLMVSYKINGLKSFDEANMLHLGVKRDWLDVQSLAKQASEAKDVRALCAGFTC